MLNIDHRHLVHIPVHWHFSLPPLGQRESGFMSKGTYDGRPQEGCPMTDEAAPPPLSEELIAKLQNAVSAAQRKRMSDPDNASGSQSPERQS